MPGSGAPTGHARVDRLLADDRYTAVVKSDVLRIFALSTAGGLYVDTDFECLRPFDDLLFPPTGLFCAREPKWGLDHRKMLSPALIGCEPGHPFMALYLQAALDAVEHEGSLERLNRRTNEVTGPYLMERLAQGRGDLTLHPSGWFYPEERCEVAPYAKHHWTGQQNWIQRPIMGGRPGEEVFHGWYAPGGPGSGAGSAVAATKDLRALLERVVREWNVRRVVDVGCGDWQWASLVDWGQAEYVGYDLVPQLIERLQRQHGGPRVRFELMDGPDTFVPPECDLLFCKDVLQHLPNREVASMIARFSPRATRLLWVNDIQAGSGNRDIERGDWRTLDLRQPPFGVPAEVLLEYATPPTRKAVLLQRGGMATAADPCGPEPVSTPGKYARPGPPRGAQDPATRPRPVRRRFQA
jgi:SAM-dependent methyltransferase